MAKSTAPAQTLNEQPVVNENLTVENGTPQAETNVSTPSFMKPIMAERQAEDEANEQTLAKLESDLQLANQNYFTVFAANQFKPNDESEKLSLPVKAADLALRDFNKKLELLKAERAVNDSLNVARYDLADKFGITLEKLDELVNASKDVKDTLKSSFTALFGKPTIFAKSGQTGKDLSKSQGTKSDVSRETSGTDGNPETGEKSRAAYDALVSGMTHDELLQHYPTVKDGVKDFTKLNGTVRVIIDRYKFKKSDDGTYAIAK